MNSEQPITANCSRCVSVCLDSPALVTIAISGQGRVHLVDNDHPACRSTAAGWQQLDVTAASLLAVRNVCSACVERVRQRQRRRAWGCES